MFSWISARVGALAVGLGSKKTGRSTWGSQIVEDCYELVRSWSCVYETLEVWGFPTGRSVELVRLVSLVLLG